MTEKELRELDAQVALKVFGIKPREVRAKGETNTVVVYRNDPTLIDGSHPMYELRWLGEPLAYSADIELAWLVVERLCETLHFRLKTEDAMWDAKFGRVDPTDFEDHHEWSLEDTAPLAICRAALKAVDHSTTAKM